MGVHYTAFSVLGNGCNSQNERIGTKEESTDIQEGTLEVV